MLKHIVSGSSLAAGAAGAFSYWKVCVLLWLICRRTTQRKQRLQFAQETQVTSSSKKPDEPKSKQTNISPTGVVLVLDMEGVSLVESSSIAQALKSSPLSEVARGPSHQIRLAEVVEALHHAGTNPRVKGLITCIGDDQSFAGPAQVQELRNAVFDFRKLKKDKVPTVAFSESFGEGGGSATLQYYLASAFEQIYVPEDGHVSLPATGLFASRLLAKWGVKADVFAVGKYKDFVTPFLDVNFNKANREATMGYLTSWKEQLVEDSAADRGLSPQEVSAAMRMSPMTAAEAVSAGLITGARWRHDAMNFIMHFPDTQQPSIMYNMAVDQSAWPAAGVNGTGYVGDLVAKAQAFAEAEGQLHNGVRADGRSLLGGVFHPWRCFIHHFCGRTGVVQTDLTYFVRMSDYIANMQHAAGAEPHMAAKPKATEALSAAKAKANESYSAVKARAGAASGEAGGAAEEAKKSHASPLTSGLMTMAASPDMANKPRVEVITASGFIVSGPARWAVVPLPLPLIGSKELCQDLRDARANDKVAAVVLRLDTPGGSALGSAAIYDEMMRYRRQGKPIVVSMGNYAASGKYYIAAGADKILAQPGSLTGSIGVAGGKINMAEPLKRLGIDAETLAVGENAAATSMFTSMTKQQRLREQKDMEKTYKTFVARIAAGRNMSEADVHKVAQGRVWTGRDAMRHGLVDSMGGLTEAIAEARRLAGLTEDNSTINYYQDFSEYKPLRFFSDLELPVPKQAITPWAGIYPNYNNHVPQLAFDATLAFRADALAVSTVSAAVGCPQTILMQAALGSQQGHMRSAAVLGLMQQYASHAQMQL